MSELERKHCETRISITWYERELGLTDEEKREMMGRAVLDTEGREGSPYIELLLEKYRESLQERYYKDVRRSRK